MREWPAPPGRFASDFSRSDVYDVHTHLSWDLERGHAGHNTPALAEDASAELLLETDGIELHGTARVVTYEASLCNVLEASHTEEEYERIKANRGQPLDVWQLDFSVYNGSGKWLDHLIALYSIESKWPDCTNWSGDGPGGGPSGTYSEPVQWTGTAGHIQETGRNVVAPGATLTATTFILVFHEDPPPQFADWSVNFRFGASARSPASSGGAARTASVPGTPPSVDRPAAAPAEMRNSVGMEFVWVPAGEFRMGSASPEAPDNVQPVTQVRISRGFDLGKYEVTQGQWEAVMGSNPSHFKECGLDCPVEEVSWEDAQEFIRRLNAVDGAGTYRLPTEAEWEYAARAGTTGDRYAADLGAIAWYDENSGDRTHPVGQKAPNAWGLHDMLGNVHEWVADWYGGYPGGTVTDPRGPGSGSYRVDRGGGWFYFASNCRSSFRGNDPPGYRSIYLGFRLLRTVP